ncbi:hypothetical protein NMT12_100032 [metagenome]
MSKDDSLELLIDNLIKQRDDLDKKKVAKLIKEKKVALSKKLGKGAIDDQGALFLIAQDLGVSLTESSPLFESSKSDFERFLDYRDYSRESSLYILEKLNNTIEENIERIQKIDQDIGNKIIDVHNNFKDIIMPSLFNDDDTWERPKDLKKLENIDIPKLSAIPEGLRQLFNRLYLAFLEKSTNVDLSTTKGLYSIHMRFQSENAFIRYPNNLKNPYFNSDIKDAIERKGKKYDWTINFETSNEFLQCYYGVLSLIDSMRNFSTHSVDLNSRQKFNFAGRKIIDPLSGIEHSGNFITLANLCVFCGYQFNELLQIWLDSQEIHKKNST